jgi:hypothetical protein
MAPTKTAPKTTNPSFPDSLVTLENLDKWVVDLFQTVKLLEAKIATLEETVSVKVKKIDELEKKLAESNNLSAPADQGYLNAAARKPTAAELQLLASARRERIEEERIKRNIIVSGIRESGANDDEKKLNDDAVVNDIVSTLGIDSACVVNHNRIRTNRSNASERPDLIRIEFASDNDRTKALSRSVNLKSLDRFKSVYLNRDMTRLERMNEKNCRDQRNELNSKLTEKDSAGRPRGKLGDRLFYWGVRSGQLRRIFDPAQA